MSDITGYPAPAYHAHPAIRDEADDFVTIHISVPKVVESWKKSLFSYEWMTPEGQIKKPDALSPAHRQQHAHILASLTEGKSLPQPVLGIGVLDCIEIGAGRDVLLTLAGVGVSVMPVHIPRGMAHDFTRFAAAAGIKSPVRTQRGNVLFYLLIAVVLLAALSFAVANTTRSGSTGFLTEGQTSALSTEVLSYSSQVRDAVARLILRGCLETQISFDDPSLTGYTNPSAPTDETCHVFSPSGGAISFSAPAEQSNNGTPWHFAGGPVVHNTAGYRSTAIAANADLVMMLFGVSQAVCEKIDERLGISSIPVDEGAYSDMTKFQGVYAALDNINGLNSTAQPSPCLSSPAMPNLCGQKAGCFQEGSGGRYIFYQVLIDR